MTRLEFYIEKIKFLAQFIWRGEWSLVKDEWRVTYSEMVDAKENLPEIEKQFIERIFKEPSDEERTD